MEPETAKLAVVSLTAIGTAVWLAALVTVVQASRDRRESAIRAAGRFDIKEKSAPGTMVGEAVVDGNIEQLSIKLAGQIARDGTGPLDPIKIIARDRNEIVFEAAVQSMLDFRGGQVRLASHGSRIWIEYVVKTSPRGYLLGAWIALRVGLVALVAAPTLALLYVVPSPNPNVRVQAFQVFQMVHFLWPPFLFAHLSRQPGRMFRARMESLVNNLLYT